jgi:septal ring factor EnvC (AmiA/AmiB activator)
MQISMIRIASHRKTDAFRKFLHALHTCAIAGMIGLFAAHPSLAQERVKENDTREQFRKSQRTLEETRAREKKIAGDLKKLEAERAALNQSLIKTASRVQASEARLSAIEKRLAGLSRQEEKIRASMQKRHDTITELLAAMQRIGRQPPPALVTRRNDALKMVRSAMLMASVFPALKAQAKGLSAELDDLIRLGKGIKTQRSNLKQENNKLIAARDRIGALVTQRQSMAQARQKSLIKIRRAAARHAKTVTYLGELVMRMDEEIAAAGLAKYEAELAELAEAKMREEALLEEAKKQRISIAKTITRKPEKVALLSPGRLKPGVPFPSRRGELAQPVSGTPIRVFGGRNKFGETTKGLSLATRNNAQVTSPVDGWVAYADKFRTYGQLLIINAGGGYHILLAGMQRIDVNVGQFVLAGEPVAAMGALPPGKSDSTNGRQVLYVEFRKDGQPIDPGPWWAKSPERVQG